MTHPATDGTRAMTPLGWAALGVVYVVWGSTYLGIGIVIESIPPLLSGGMRFLIAAFILAAALTMRHGPRVLRVSRRQLGSATLIGILLLTGGNGMVVVAEQHISTGLTALLVAAVPLWLVVFRQANGDRPSLVTVMGVAIGFLGVAVLSLLNGGGPGSALGIALALLASLSWSTGSFVSGRLPMPSNSFVTSVYQMLAGGLSLLAAGAARGEALDFTRASARSWAAFLYLIIFGSLLAFTAYSWLLGKAPISLVSTYAYVNPAVAVLLGALILGEHVTWPTLLGGSIIVIGVAFVVSTERKAKPPVMSHLPATATRQCRRG